VLIAIISDTHLPRGGRRLPDECVRYLRGADHIVHAGDFVEVAILEQLRRYGPPLTAVHGNVDCAELVPLLPARCEVQLGGVRLGVVHDAGPAGGRLERMRASFSDAHAVVFGHSHIPLHERGSGFQIFNPGSPTDRRAQPEHTMGLAHVDGSTMRFEHVSLGAA
jgi:putative phosphoesterase